MKIIALLPAALIVVAAPAAAGPYLNVEMNSGFSGSDYGGTVIDNHVGYKKDNWYIQAGPAIVAPDGGDTELELSGKVGGSVDLSDNVSAYGEVSFMTSDSDNNFGTKIGLVYEFWLESGRTFIAFAYQDKLPVVNDDAGNLLMERGVGFFWT